jgi:hypothetical protein
MGREDIITVETDDGCNRSESAFCREVYSVEHMDLEAVNKALTR